MAFDSSLNFTYTGTTAIWDKPLGVSSVFFILNGGGGGGGITSDTNGGGGAYVFTNYNYLNPFTTYPIYINVGSGGQAPPSQAGGKSIGGQNDENGYYECNGGSGSTLLSLQSGGGGGMTTVFDASGTLIKIIAGGGGGAGNNFGANGGDGSTIGLNGSGAGGGQGGNTNSNGNGGLGGINGGTNGYSYLDSSYNEVYIFQGGGGGGGGTFAGGGGGAGYGGAAGGRQGGGGGGGSYSLPIARNIFVAGGGGVGGTRGKAGGDGSVLILWNSIPIVLPHPFVEMFMLNAQHTCKSIYHAPTILPSAANIKSYFSNSTTFPNSAVVNSNDNIYIIAGDGRLYAFNSDLSFRWSYTAPSNYKFIGTPALSNDLTLYIAATTTTAQNYLFAIIDNGSGNNISASIKWQYAISGNSAASPVLDLNDIVYIGTDNGLLYAIVDGYNKGLPNWPTPYTSPDNNPITGSPVFDLSYNRLCYTTSNTTTQTSSIYALTLAPGNATLPTLTWSYAAPNANEYYGTPSIDENKIIYVPSSLNKVYAYNNLGVLQWGGPRQVLDTNLSAIAIDTDYLYFTSKQALNVMNRTTGVIEWTYYFNRFSNSPVSANASPNNSIPVIDQSNNIYFGARDGYLYSVHVLSRKFNWKYKTGGSIQCMPVINNIGNILFGSNDGYIYDLSGNGISPPTSTPIVAMYMLNTQHTGQSPYAAPLSKPQQSWTTTTIKSGNLFVLPSISIASDGTLYLGSDDGYLYALNPANGNIQPGWPVSMIKPIPVNRNISSANSVYLTPLIAPDGTIYAGTNQGYLFAFTPNGAIKWFYRFNRLLQSSPIIDASGTIYFGSDKFMYAIGDSGTEPYNKWLIPFAAGDNINSSPALGQNGYLYFGSDDGYVYALDSFTGLLIWSFNATADLLPAGVHPIYSSPTVDQSNNVLIGNGSDMDGVLYYLNGTTGSVIWTYPSPPQSQTGSSVDSLVGPFYNAPAVSGNTIYLSTMTYIYAIDRLTGIENWRYYKAKCYYSSAIVDLNGFILFTSIDARTNHGFLHSLTDQGKENWSYDTGTVGRLAAPTLGADGTIYVSSTANRIYALR